MKPKTYEILRRAVEQGVALGINRAHKHVESPTQESLAQTIEESVMGEICDWFSFDDEP